MAVFTGEDDISYWKWQMHDPNSCVSTVVSTMQFSLPPRYIGRIREGVREVLNMDLRQYSKTLNGILVAYEKVKLKTKCAEIIGDQTFLPINVTANFIVFTPTVGCILKGVVNKLSMTHIGCLVHNYFNASIPLPRDEFGNISDGMNIAVNEEITFEVTGMDLASKIIFFKGQLINASPSSELIEIQTESIENVDGRDSSSGYHTATGSVSDAGIDSSRKRKRKSKEVEEVDDGHVSRKMMRIENEETADLSVADSQNSTKKRKKNSKTRSEPQDHTVNLSVEEEGRELQEQEVHKKRKKKKKHEPEGADAEDTDIVAAIAGNEKLKKKKKKHRDINKEISDNETCAVVPKEISVKDLKKIRKHGSKSKICSVEESDLDENARKSKKKRAKVDGSGNVIKEEQELLKKAKKRKNKIDENSPSDVTEPVKKRKKKKKDKEKDER